MASSLDASMVPSLLYISGIFVDFSNSNKNVESAEVRIGESPTLIEREHGAGKALRRTFSPPMELSRGDTLSLHIRYKKWLGMKTDHEDIVFEPEDMFGVCGANEREEYNKIHKNFTIIVELSGKPTTEDEQLVPSSGETLELQPTTDEISRICPRFRILVIGKTGAGKSSLIERAFGVEKTLTSHEIPGKAEIDIEFISQRNSRFVVHDSKGFEPGEKDNLKIVRDFIERRRNMITLEHQLHAVWLCFEIPRASGRLLETGTEEFLTLKRGGTLGKIPVVVVLTKYDMLIDRMERTLDGPTLNGLSDNAIKGLAKNKAEAELQNMCIRPLEEFAGPDIPHATISTKECYKETLACLIRMTENCVRQNFTPEAAVMTSIAQRADPRLNIKASIEVGKRKCWNTLASSAAFKTHTTWDCLHVLHTDIVAVWNFHDPHGYLHSQEFRTMVTNMVNSLDVRPTANPNKTLTVGMATVSAIAGIISALVGPAAPIVVPIAACVVLVVWVHDVYQRSRMVLQRFMAYIIDLTLVLHLVSESREITRRVIKLAVVSYLTSPITDEVHARIQEYDREMTLLDRTDRDVVGKIIEVIEFYSISADTIFELRAKIPVVGSLLDEPWKDEKA